LGAIDALPKILAAGSVKYVQDAVLRASGGDADRNQLSIGRWRVVIDRVVDAVRRKSFWIQQETLCRIGPLVRVESLIVLTGRTLQVKPAPSVRLERTHSDAGIVELCDPGAQLFAPRNPVENRTRVIVLRFHPG
jgi:hypothetical protein